MDYQLARQLVFVSAGAHGIGQAVADLFAQRRRRRSLSLTRMATPCLRNGATGSGPSRPISPPPTGSPAPCPSSLDAFGRAPDVVINNLGVGDAGVFEDLSDERWERSFQTNLMGSVRLCRALVPKMAARGSGAVVITGSDLAKQPEPGFMDYGSCKAGLLYLTKALAKQYAPKVRVNTVLPGPIWSRMWTRPGGIVDQLTQHYGLDRDASVQRFLEDRQMPMGIGQPEDVAHAVLFLASPRARFITGAALDIGGTIRGLI